MRKRVKEKGEAVQRVKGRKKGKRRWA